jgi:hypothetical protein
VLTPSVVCIVLVFGAATPYVWLDAGKALTDMGVMAREHALENRHALEVSSLRHLVGYNLRYGLGLIPCLALAAGLLWRPWRMSPGEGVVVAALFAFVLFAAAASSAFMRYAVPWRHWRR